ncbi:Heat shock 70 kDa protein [Rhynchospora pubera]|uniref:Heat shock 70 kDa protein n=1 Tax=Rhynchospora pubera TaxID=906938 RepID=A0AAV8D244_9POAL|nr:Heat shock 70 kDa protein [Rhynchospora pubera]
MNGSGSSSGSGTKGPAIGIDLGTAYTRVALFDGTGEFRMIPDDHGKPAMPSYVAFVGSEVLVGEAARKQAVQNPANTIFDVIRLIGSSYSHPLVKNEILRWPFMVVAGENDMLLVEVHWKGKSWQFTPVEICSMILIHVKKNAETNVKATITDVVMTVPVQFNYEQRQAIKEAGMIAGLNVMQIISAPAASALFFGTERLSTSSGFFNIFTRFRSVTKEYNMIIFDLGAGTLDVSLITIKERVCRVRATAGHVHLGGSNFDANLVYYFLHLLNRDGHKDIKNIFRVLMSEHRMVFEGAKVALFSGINSEPMVIGPLYNNQNFVFSISAEEFNSLNEKLFKKCIDTISACLGNAGMEAGMVDEVILAGGSTRITMLQAHINNYFKGKELNVSSYLETSVACGAALQAFFLSSSCYERVRCLSLQNATSFPLGIQIPSVMNFCIAKNTTIPTRIEKKIPWHYNKGKLLVEVFEGEESLNRESKLLGKLEFSGVPISPNGRYFNLCFIVDANGTLTVTTGESSGGMRNGITLLTYNIEVSRRRVLEALHYKEVEEVSKDISRTESLVEIANSHKRKQIREKQDSSLPTGGDEKSKKIMGQSSRQHVDIEEYSIGIDFGTSYSCVAVWQRNVVKIIEMSMAAVQPVHV